jgi:hypothetical protein
VLLDGIMNTRHPEALREAKPRRTQGGGSGRDG